MDNNDIANRIEKLGDTFESKMSKLEEKIDNIYNKTYVGNGQPAIVDRLSRIEHLQETCPARTGVSNESKSVKISFVAVVVATVAIIVNWFKG